MVNNEKGLGTEGENESPLNCDLQTVKGFGEEWSCFTQRELDQQSRGKIFSDYFSIFPWEILPAGAVGADVGCGSGRWAQLVAPRVGCLHLIDASEEALRVARENLLGATNVEFHHASVDALPFEDGYLDFAYSLGVLHHVPDTPAAIRQICQKLKPGAPLLLYLYYAFDNRGPGYRYLWKLSDALRRMVARLPFILRYPISQVLAGGVYWPLARTARLLEYMKLLPEAWPLAYYRDKPFYVMRTDALDRFGTRLEQRFSRDEITRMLEDAEMDGVRFSESAPFWCVTARKKQP